MSEKKVPFTKEQLEAIAAEFGTPFHIYLEQGIRDNARELIKAFAWAPKFREHFAVKALPNPYIVQILAQEGCGADCSSLPELILAEKAGIQGEAVCFTANDVPAAEFIRAKEMGATINLDDITHIKYLEECAGLPELISFRYNPGPLREGGNTIIGTPEEAKYGLTRAQLLEGIDYCLKRGVKRFGLHTMVVSNELNVDYLIETSRMMFELAVEVKEKTGVKVDFVNLGGGIGVPYKPEQQKVDLQAFGQGVRRQFEAIMVPNGLDQVMIALESGRMMTGPFGYLVCRAIHRKDTYKHYIGVDSCMAHLMRPALYGAYHHITVMGKENAPCDHVYDVVGSLCENNDKFAINRELPEIQIGDLLVIHDTGAHGLAMGFNYNGKLRCQELLYQADGTVKRIRRAETLADYFATLDFPGLHQ